MVDQLRVSKVARTIPSGSRILDIGCGSGLLISVLPPRSSYTGVDRDTAVVEADKRRFPYFDFHCLDAVTSLFPFHDEQFDVVVMAAFLEHVDQPKVMFTEIKRVLKPGGRVLVTTPSRWGGAVHAVLSKLGFLSAEAAEEHQGYWNKKKMDECLKLTGLHLKWYEPFQFGLNQLFILTRGHHE